MNSWRHVHSSLRAKCFHVEGWRILADLRTKSPESTPKSEIFEDNSNRAQTQCRFRKEVGSSSLTQAQRTHAKRRRSQNKDGRRGGRPAARDSLPRQGLYVDGQQRVRQRSNVYERHVRGDPAYGAVRHLRRLPNLPKREVRRGGARRGIPLMKHAPPCAADG